MLGEATERVGEKKITQLLFLSLQIPLSSRFFAFLAYFPSFPRALAAFRKLCFVFCCLFFFYRNIFRFTKFLFLVLKGMTPGHITSPCPVARASMDITIWG